MKINVIVESGKDSYSCYMENSKGLDFSLVGCGKTAKAAVEDFYAARDEMKDYYKEQGMVFPDVEFVFHFDVGALFDYYPLNITALANYINMNGSLLRQYATGIKRPSARTLEKLNKGLETLGKAFAGGVVTGKSIRESVR